MLLDFQITPKIQSLKEKMVFTTPVRTSSLNTLPDQANKNRFSTTDRTPQDIRRKNLISGIRFSSPQIDLIPTNATSTTFLNLHTHLSEEQIKKSNEDFQSENLLQSGRFSLTKKDIETETTIHTLQTNNQRWCHASQKSLTEAAQSDNDPIVSVQRNEIYQLKLSKDDSDRIICLIEKLTQQIAHIQNQLSNSPLQIKEKLVVQKVKVNDNNELENLRKLILKSQEEANELEQLRMKKQVQIDKLKKEVDGLYDQQFEEEPGNEQIVNVFKDINIWKEKCQSCEAQTILEQDELQRVKIEIEIIQNQKLRVQQLHLSILTRRNKNEIIKNYFAILKQKDKFVIII